MFLFGYLRTVESDVEVFSVSFCAISSLLSAASATGGLTVSVAGLFCVTDSVTVCSCGSVSYIVKSAGSHASAEESVRTAVRTRRRLIQRFKNLGLSRDGPLHGDLKGRATGPFRRTSGGEAESPAAG